MTAIAVSTPGVTIYYSAILIALGTAACFLLAYALYSVRGGKGIAMCVFTPLAIFLSIFLSRVIHWYCHMEQYAGFLSAVTDYGTGDFVLSGALVGVALAALITRWLKLADDTALMLDCTAAAAPIAIAFIRLSCLYNTSCISKIAITKSAFQKLPFGYTFTDAAGNTEYRFATFFVEFLLMFVLLAGLCIFLNNREDVPAKGGSSNAGSTAMMFLVWYGMIELVMDSTRYDSSFAHFNGFVSIVQMVCAISMIIVLVFYSIRATKADGTKLRHWAVWIGFFLALAVTGVSEYMVQRHGDWYRICYTTMTIGDFFMAFAVTKMYYMQCDE